MSRDTVRLRPPEAQIVMAAIATKLSLDDNNPDWEFYIGVALQKWDHVLEQFRDGGSTLTEGAIAARVIAEMRKQKGWGDILRGSAS